LHPPRTPAWPGGGPGGAFGLAALGWEKNHFPAQFVGPKPNKKKRGGPGNRGGPGAKKGGGGASLSSFFLFFLFEGRAGKRGKKTPGVGTPKKTQRKKNQHFYFFRLGGRRPPGNGIKKPKPPMFSLQKRGVAPQDNLVFHRFGKTSEKPTSSPTISTSAPLWRLLPGQPKKQRGGPMFSACVFNLSKKNSIRGASRGEALFFLWRLFFGARSGRGLWDPMFLGGGLAPLLDTEKWGWGSGGRPGVFRQGGCEVLPQRFEAGGKLFKIFGGAQAFGHFRVF